MADPAGSADAAGIRVPAACDQPVDVLFDGQRVFTAATARVRTAEDGLRTLRWPRVLQSHLHGRAEITVRDHVTGHVWVQQEVAFDEAEERLAVADADGYPLAVDKWGFLVRTFDSTDESLVPRLLDDLDRLLTALRDGFGVPAFLAYGTLLGAVRAGSFIGHDNDADISYVSRFENPADVARESFALQRWLVGNGWQVRRSTAGFLQVWADESAEEQRKIDIFAGYFCGDHFAIERWVRAPMSRTAILPLGHASLEGRQLPAPATPEVLLAATYGPGWRVPDPAFAFRVPASTSARSDGWFGEAWLDRWRWNEDAQGRSASNRASSFARWVDQRIDPSAAVVDVGSGDGADAVWLARDGRTVTGLDYADWALAAAREHAAGSDARFEELTLLDFRAVVVRAARIVADGVTAGGPAPVVYVHRTLDALTPGGRANLWQLARIVRGRTFLEFTTPIAIDGAAQTPEPPYRFTNDADRVAAEVRDRGGRVGHQETLDIDGSNVCRMVVDWPA